MPLDSSNLTKNRGVKDVISQNVTFIADIKKNHNLRRAFEEIGNQLWER